MAISALNNGDTGLQARTIINALVTSANAGVSISGESHVVVTAGGTAVQNAAALQAAYTAAKSETPYGSALSATNRYTIIAAPGYYDFESTAFTMDAQYIDLVSLDGNRSVIFNSENSAGTISITANDVFVKGVDVQTKVFTIATNLNLLKVENCKGGEASFGNGITVSGTFTNCSGGVGSFGGEGTASGTFTNCTGSGLSFGGVGSFGGNGTASGTFTNCRGGFGAFAGGDMSGGTASGTFTNCTGSVLSFGNSDGGVLSGKLYYCRLTSGTFNTVSGAGKTRLCIDGSDVENNQG
jgi:hypothetical protein